MCTSQSGRLPRFEMFEAIDGCRLEIFLLGNVITGLVNLFYCTLCASVVQAVIVWVLIEVLILVQPFVLFRVWDL